MGAQLDTMVMEPLAIPAAPKPATKRPTMSMADETAAPQRAEPTSNTAKNTRNDHYSCQMMLGEKRNTSCKAHSVPLTLVLK